MPSVLIVEDDPGIASMVARYLQGRGYRCSRVSDTTQAQRHLEDSPPDVVLLDWMLPGGSGYDFARAMKSDPKRQATPLIMLSARVEEHDKIRALDAGADDYITKPFSLAELASRINALLRRTSPAVSAPSVQVAGLSIDRETRRVTAMGHNVVTGPTEFELLYFFMTHQERVYSRLELIHHLWDPRTQVEERTVDVHIRRLRKALQPHGLERLIQTVRSAGYRMSTTV